MDESVGYTQPDPPYVDVMGKYPRGYTRHISVTRTGCRLVTFN